MQDRGEELIKDRFEKDGTPKYFCAKKISIRRIEKKTFEQLSHEKYNEDLYSGKLLLILENEQDLFIGSGEVEIKNDKQYLAFARIYSENHIVIPGSSLKGAIRIYLEALSPSCVSSDRDACGKTEEPCPACAIFGRQDYQGRVFFKDAKLLKGNLNDNKEIIQRRPPWLSCRDRRFYYFEKPDIVHGRQDKERIEVVNKGAQFNFEIEFINLLNWELGLLLLSMGLDDEHQKDFSLKIGGAKNRKCGKVKINLEKIDIINKKEWLRKMINGEVEKEEIKNAKTEFLNAYWKKCEEWGVKNQVEKIIQKFKSGAPNEKQKRAT